MTPSDKRLSGHIGFRSATALVIANMIGAGIFTSTGFQAADLGHPGYIFLLWIVGGVLALCGALCYAELGAAMPEAGGEYVYLRETYGKAFGFMSASVSLVAGFSAPIASAVKSFGRYLVHFFPGLESDPAVLGTVTANDLIAVGLTWFLVLIHLTGTRRGVRFSDLITFGKVAGIVLIVLAAVAVGKGSLSNLTVVAEPFGAMGGREKLAAFGTSLIFVMFCYSGWNASAYVASEMENPQRDLPRSLLVGTGIVLALYLFLNAVYFYGADVNELAGKVEVGLIASRSLFGSGGATLVTCVILVSLLASASAMTIIGPRVYYALGRDFLPFAGLARVSGRTGVPATAIVVQGVVTSIIILLGRVDQIQQYAGFTLTLFGSLAVSCVIVLRLRRPTMERPFRAWGYPATPLLFLGIAGWTMFWSIQGRPTESIFGLLTVAASGAAYFLAEWAMRRKV